jgi:hypothetical protein
MSFYFPQAAMTLRVLWEDFGEVQSAKLQKVYELPILARRVTVNINDYTQADTFDAEIDFKQFPFDPRSIRACGVTIHLQDMKKLDDDGIVAKIKPLASNTLFQGFADEEGITFDDMKRTVKLQGRDFTALLIDRPYVGAAIDLNRPLDALISSLLAGLPETAKMTLDVRIEGELPVIAKYAADLTPLNGTISQKKNDTYWEIIQDLVHRAGLIAYVELDKLVITNPRALYSTKKAVKFIYGKNIKDLQYNRKLGRKKNFNVAVRSFNPLNKSEPVITARIPLEATADWTSKTGIPQKVVMLPTMNVDGSQGADKEAPTISFLIPNVNNKSKLIEIGEGIYEELGRQQIEGSFETHEMVAPSGTDIFDLLKIRNGTPIKIQLDQGDLEGISKISNPNATGDKKQQSITNTRQFLINRGYKTAIADALAETINNPRFNSPFYTKGVEFTLDADTGFKIKVTFINFIELSKSLGGNG